MKVLKSLAQFFGAGFGIRHRLLSSLTCAAIVIQHCQNQDEKDFAG